MPKKVLSQCKIHTFSHIALKHSIIFNFVRIEDLQNLVTFKKILIFDLNQQWSLTKESLDYR